MATENGVPILGVEIDLIAKDSVAALKLYESIFGDAVQRVEVTALDVGMNEAVFTLYGTRFHMLDENPEYQMFAPKKGEGKPIWFNVVVPDIRATYAKAMAGGCTEIQPVTEMPEMGIINAMFTDLFGHMWMLHQIERVVSFEERCRILGEEAKGDAP